ncbi:MAG: hypothetical protein HZA90_27180 [Verrucomicrobia bacterium]|nr:hypothetical protein [Verrucomicrobiota bacterium]
MNTNTNDDSTAVSSLPEKTSPPSPWPVATIVAGLLSWGAISLGFLGMKMLMQERPEFVGPPMRGTKAEMVQESPQIVARKVSDDVSLVKPMPPELSDVRFDMAGRRDYRGLRTIMDMSGEFRARYVLTNALEEPVFVLFKCPHPRAGNATGGTLLAGGLKLQASVHGTQEQAKDAWFWSGTLDAHGGASIDISYQVASLKGVAYRVGEQNGNPVKQLRVTFQRRDLESMRFETGDGTKPSADATVVWERRDFLAPDFFSGAIVETRNLFVSLLQLSEIGPLICLLFLLAVSAVILARQPLTAVQMLTIAAGYALYFPLILYLSARFSFAVALVIAVVVPGALLVNYARWLVGSRLGLLGGPVFLALYWVFPTLAAFAGWNRGLVLLCLGVVTLWVLINLQNQALRRKTAVAVLLLWLASPYGANAGEMQVVFPADLTGKLLEANRETVPAVVSFEPVEYQVGHEATHFRVEARMAFHVLRPGDRAVALFAVPVHLIEAKIDSAETNLAGMVTVSNRLAAFAQRPGPGTMRLSYRVPMENREGKRRAQIPLFAGLPGNVRLESARSDLEILSGSLWAKRAADKQTTYDIGVAGEETLVMEWRDPGGGAPAGTGPAGESAREFYGIGLTRAQHLTVVNSDGSCTHFAEFELPAFQAEEFRMKLPAKTRLISVSVNGNEISAPAVEDQLCRIRLPGREAQQTAHRLSFRFAYPALRLGFIGTVDLTLPEVFQTTGTTEWVVALPSGFHTQLLSSGLEMQKTPPDLGRFGDYGRILKSHAHTYLAKDLAPPGLVGLSLKYRQVVPGLYEAKAE